MIKLKNILLEGKGVRRKIVNPSVAIDFIKENCHMAVANARDGKFLYRGIESESHPFLYMDPSLQRRQAKGTNSLYMAIMGASPKWIEYPNREYSIMVSPDLSRAEEFGNSYYVFIPDDASIACTNDDEGDLWHSMKYLESRLQMGISHLMNIISRFPVFFGEESKLPNISSEHYDSRNINIFYEKMKLLTTEKIRENLHSPNDKLFAFGKKILFEDMLKHPDSENGWRNYFEDLFDPKKNDITLENTNSVPYGKDEECWTDSSVILIHNSINIDNVLEEL